MSSHLLNIAKLACRHFHARQRFKHTAGPYYEHPEAVADLVSTNAQKILALLHDVIEDTVKHKFKEFLLAPDDPDRREFEDIAIGMAFDKVREFFQSNGASAMELNDLETFYFPQLNALTRRSYDSYETYREKLINFVEGNRSLYINTVVVKIADSTHNGEQDRNLPTRRDGQNVKTVATLKRYALNIQILLRIFPEALQYLRTPPEKRPQAYMKASRPPDRRRSSGERLRDGYGEFNAGD